jgi:hypothetical protein
MVAVMSPLLKFLLPLVVVLPLGGFVAGSLVSAAQDDPGPRTPIVLREDSSRTPTTGTPTDAPTNSSRPPDDDSGRDDDGDDNGDDDGDDHVVSPEPVDNDGDVDDDGDDGAEDDNDDGDEGDDD